MFKIAGSKCTPHEACTPRTISGQTARSAALVSSSLHLWETNMNGFSAVLMAPGHYIQEGLSLP